MTERREDFAAMLEEFLPVDKAIGSEEIIKGTVQSVRRDFVLVDVNFKSAQRKAAAITPVPGGIGPITVARLLKNVLILTKANLSKKT